MTTQKISDAARELVRGILRSVALATMPHDDNPLELAQSALTAARQEAAREMRERAAKLVESNVVNTNGVTDGKSGSLMPQQFPMRDVVRGTFADAIRALPVEGE